VTTFENSYESLTGEWEAEQGGQEVFGELLSGELTGGLNEAQEAQLAAELLEINSEEELDHFFKDLVRGAVKGVTDFARSGAGKALVGGLKNVAKVALPAVGGALGTAVLPGVGTAIGSKLGSVAGSLFELEMETMSEEEAEFAVAQEVVRLGARAARNAASAPRKAPPRAVARAAILTAARRHAPGLARRLRSDRRPPYPPPRRRRPPAPGYAVAYPTPRQPAGGYAEPPAAGRSDDEPDGDYEPDGDGDGDMEAARWDGSSGGRQRTGRWTRRGRTIVLHGV
jgi:uncharacterized protein (DUF697 family)